MGCSSFSQRFIVLLVRSRELESLALWLKEPTGQNTLILEVSSLRHFCAKHRDFPPGNFCTLCRILQVRVPHCIPWNRAKTVQKPCTYSWTNKKWWFLIHDLVAIWVTTEVNLIHGKKNAHSSEEFSGEWAVLYNGVLYMSLATFSIEVAIFWDEVATFSVEVATFLWQVSALSALLSTLSVPHRIYSPR